MGCMMTKRAHSTPSAAAFLLELNPYLFKVANVDDSGEEQNHGLLEVRDQELLFHQASSLTVLRNGDHHRSEPNGTANGSARTDNGRGFVTAGSENPPPICWPLKSLRRYGFDADLFSFESGRRCATGPGIYAFRCERAETLFNLVQDSIIRLGQAEEEEANRRRLLRASSQSSAPSFPGFRSRLVGPATSPIMSSCDPSNFFNRRNDSHNHQRIHFNRSISTPCREGDRNYINDKNQQSHEYLNQSKGNEPDCANRHSNYYVNQDVDISSQMVEYAQLMVPPRAESGSLSVGDEVDDEDYDEERDCFDSDLPPLGSGCKYVNLSKVDASVFEGRHSASVPARLRRVDAPFHQIPASVATTSSSLVTSSTYPKMTCSRSAPVARVAPLHFPLRNYINVDGIETSDDRPVSESPEGQVNYIQLDLDGGFAGNGATENRNSYSPLLEPAVVEPRRGVLKSDSSVQRSPRVAGGSVGDSYATIDLRRTRAVSCRAVHAEAYDEGSRKTRHNSNIES